MSLVNLEIRRWNWRRWLLYFAAVFLVQLLFLYLLSARTTGISKPSQAKQTFRLIPKRITETEFLEQFLTTDPTLFIVPTLSGFSGPAWLQVPARIYELSDAAEIPFWLSINPEQLGHTGSRFVRTNSLLTFAASEKALPKILNTQSVPSIDNARTNSTLRIEGEIASLELLNPQQLTNWAHSEILSNSVTHIVADKSGMVILTRLISRSGKAEADRLALETARLFQFSAGPAPLISGTAIFEWHTVSPPTTNLTGKAGSP